MSEKKKAEQEVKVELSVDEAEEVSGGSGKKNVSSASKGMASMANSLKGKPNVKSRPRGKGI